VKVEFEGVTGRIQFDSQGYRSNFTLDVLEMTFNSKPKKVRLLEHWSYKPRHLLAVQSY